MAGDFSGGTFQIGASFFSRAHLLKADPGWFLRLVFVRPSLMGKSFRCSKAGVRMSHFRRVSGGGDAWSED